MADHEKKALQMENLEVTELEDADLEGVSGGDNDGCSGVGPNTSCSGSGPNKGCSGPGNPPADEFA
jgi:hypothetical protein